MREQDYILHRDQLPRHLRLLGEDVETRGELTLGMSVFDVRWGTTARPNVELAVNVDLGGVRDYIHHTLGAQE